MSDKDQINPSNLEPKRKATWKASKIYQRHGCHASLTVHTNHKTMNLKLEWHNLNQLKWREFKDMEKTKTNYQWENKN